MNENRLDNIDEEPEPTDKHEELLKNNEFFNPKKKFNSLTEAMNFVDKEWKQEKVEKELKGLNLPINIFDPQYNHHKMFKLLNKVPQRTDKEKLYIRILKSVIAVSTEAQLCKVYPTFMQIRSFLAGHLNVTVKEFVEMERRALDYVRSFLSNRNMGTFGEN